MTESVVDDRGSTHASIGATALRPKLETRNFRVQDRFISKIVRKDAL
jgi:hypothetical protein